MAKLTQKQVRETAQSMSPTAIEWLRYLCRLDRPEAFDGRIARGLLKRGLIMRGGGKDEGGNQRYKTTRLGRAVYEYMRGR